MSDLIRGMLEKAGRSWRTNKGSRKLGIGTLIVFLFTLFLLISLVTLTIWLVKGLVVGGARNRELYLPGKFQNKELYFPKVRR